MTSALDSFLGNKHFLFGSTAEEGDTFAESQNRTLAEHRDIRRFTEFWEPVWYTTLHCSCSLNCTIQYSVVSLCEKTYQDSLCLKSLFAWSLAVVVIVIVVAGVTVMCCCGHACVLWWWWCGVMSRRRLPHVTCDYPYSDCDAIIRIYNSCPTKEVWFSW